MWKAVWASIYGALSDASSVVGLLMSAIWGVFAISGNAGGWPLVFLASAVILFFYRAASLSYELERERESSRSLGPTITLSDTVNRIRGKDKISGDDDLQKIVEIFAQIREKARNMEIIIYGKDLDALDKEEFELEPRGFISFDFWSQNKIDSDLYFIDLKGKTKPIGVYKIGDYEELWLDQNQVNKIWPLPKQTWKEWFKSKYGKLKRAF